MVYPLIAAAHNRSTVFARYANVHITPLAQPSRHLKRKLHRFGRFGRTNAALSLSASLRRPICPKNLLLSVEALDRHQMHGTFGPPDPPAQTASRSSLPFFHKSRSLPTTHKKNDDGSRPVPPTMWAKLIRPSVSSPAFLVSLVRSCRSHSLQ